MKNQLEESFRIAMTIAILIMMLVFSLGLTGQTMDQELKATVKEKLGTSGEGKLDVGTIVFIYGFMSSDMGTYYRIRVGDKKYIIKENDIDKLDIEITENLTDMWTLLKIKEGYYVELAKTGVRYDIRKELEEEILDYIIEVENNDGFFNDEYLTDYLNRLLLSIHPSRIGDSRPGCVSIKVLKSSIPNAYSMSNGTVLVTTGLLSTLRSEEELIGVLAHEVAHFVLDHHVKNVLKEVQRVKRAEFWATFATVVAAAGEVYMNVEHDVYTGGLITQSTAAISYSLANALAQRVGSKYSIEQETEADRIARRVLESKKINPKAYKSAMLRIGEYMFVNGVYEAFTGGATHPSISERVGKIDMNDSELFNNDVGYDRLVSIVNSYNAMLEYGSSHFESSLDLASRNIGNEVATEDDYLIKNMSLRILFDSPEKNQEALEALEIAKSLNINPTIYIDKQEGLTLLRLKRQQDAILAFKSYLEKLQSLKETDKYIDEEIDWARIMIHKATYL